MGNLSSSSDELRLRERIDAGSYGEVFRATWENKLVAAKRIHRVFLEDAAYRCNKEKVLASWEKEWVLLRSLNHLNIVKYYTVILEEPPIIVMELCDCDLRMYIKNTKPRVAFANIVRIMRDVAEGLRYLHEFKPDPIVHRDLSSKNILLTAGLQAKIADLGLAKVFPEITMLATPGVGTPIYAAPETVRVNYAQRIPYSAKVDIFSYGAIMLEMIVGHLPSYLPAPVLQDGEIVPEYIRRSEDICEMGINHPLRPLVIRCFSDKPEARFSAGEIVDFLRRFEHTSIPPAADRSAVQRLSHQKFDHSFKVAFLGEGGVGKTTIIRRFVNPCENIDNNTHHQNTMSPGDFFERLELRGKTVHLHIVDTPGESRSVFHLAESTVPLIYRALSGAVIVFDVTDRKSFERVPTWLDKVQEHCGHEIPVVLVGNKTDRPLNSWKIPSNVAAKYATNNGFLYIETSALGMCNIDEIFAILLELLMQQAEQTTGDRSWMGDSGNDHAIAVLLEPERPISLLKGDVPPSVIPEIVARERAEPTQSHGTVQLPPTARNEGKKSDCRCWKSPQ